MPVPSSIADLSTTPSSNSPAGSETPSSTDDYLRTLSAFIKQAYNAAQGGTLTWCGTAGGTANAITLTPSPAITAYAAGQVFRFKSGASANTGATTVAISGLAAIALQLNGAACVGGEILANKWYEILLTSATNAQLIGSYIHTTGNETKDGVLTFTSSPVVPTPTLANQASDMGYVDGGTGTEITTTGTTLTSSAARKFIDINSATATATTLMAASSLLDGQSFTLTNIGAGIATFNCAGSDTVTGGNLSAATSISLNKGETATLTKVNGSFRVTASNVTFFGAPQTWQDVLSSRVAGTTYTNTTGRAIEIQIGFSAITGNPEIFVDGAMRARTTSNTNNSPNLSATVPNLSTYSAQNSVPALRWQELR